MSGSAGLTTNLPSSFPIRTAPTCVGNGMSETASAAEAPFIARMSYGLTWSMRHRGGDDLRLALQPFGNNGRIGRSIMRAVRIPFSEGRPSRLKKPPGIFPAAYIRSSTSTVSGRKSTSRGLPAVAVQRIIDVASTHNDGAACLLGKLPRLERDLVPTTPPRRGAPHQSSCFPFRQPVWLHRSNASPGSDWLQC